MPTPLQMTMVPRACPVCGRRGRTPVFARANFDATRLDAYAFASRKLPEYMHHRLLACPVCDVVFASPLPTAAALATAYEEAAYDSAEEARFAAQTYGRLLDSLVAHLPDRRGALDIGAGDGAFLTELLARGFTEVQGVEPSTAPIAHAPAAVRPLIRQDMFRAADFPPAGLALVTCFQTIEHVDDPLALCRSAYGLLKPGGALFIIGHNRRSLSARLLGEKSPIFDIEHLQLFSLRSARRLLARAGFRDIVVQPITNRYPLHYWLKLFPLPLRLKRPLLARLKQGRIGHILIRLPAGNLAAVGYRPAAPRS